MNRGTEGGETRRGRGLGAALLVALLLPPATLFRQADFIPHPPAEHCGLDTIHRIDLNRAGAAELTLIPGIGPRLAAALVEYRNRSGPFLRLEDIQRVHGLGPAKAAAMDGWILTDGRGNLPIPAGNGIR